MAAVASGNRPLTPDPAPRAGPAIRGSPPARRAPMHRGDDEDPVVGAGGPLLAADADPPARREQMAAANGGKPPAAKVTWSFCFEQANRLSPDGGAPLLLALAALLDGNGMPGALFTTSAACKCLAGDSGAGRADRERAWDLLLLLRRSGLLAIDLAGSQATVRMSRAVRAAVRAETPRGILERAASAAADALLEVWPAGEPQAWLSEDLRSCAASLQAAAGDLLWAGGCHPLLLRAGQSLDTARLTVPPPRTGGTWPQSVAGSLGPATRTPRRPASDWPAPI